MKATRAIFASLVVQGMVVALACGAAAGATSVPGAASLSSADWTPVGANAYWITSPSEGDHILSGQNITFFVWFRCPLGALPPNHLRFGLYGDVNVDLLNRPYAWYRDSQSYSFYWYRLDWTVPNRQGFDAYPPFYSPLSPATGPQYGCIVEIKREVCYGEYCWFEILDRQTNIVLVVHGGTDEPPLPCDPTQDGGCMKARAMQEFSTWGRIKATFR